MKPANNKGIVSIKAVITDRGASNKDVSLVSSFASNQLHLCDFKAIRENKIFLKELQ